MFLRDIQAKSGMVGNYVVARLVTTLNVRAMMVFPSGGVLQSSLIDRVPPICRPTNAQSCVFSSYDVIPGAQGGASAPKAPLPPLDPRLTS